jgi:FRG domain
MNDIRVADWPELLKALYDIPKTSHQRHRSDFVYRGVADQSWGLETSLKRLGGEFVNVERPLLRSFRKYAEPGSIPAETLWVRLSVAQHHGLPTRVLDWTVSPKVAVHFATAEEDHYDKDGAIWCIDVVKARSLLPKALRDVLENEYAFLFSVEMLDIIESLSEFDSLATEYGSFVLFFEPPSLDARIVNQGAIMSVMPGATLVLSEFLEGHPEICMRIIIPKELKWEIRDKLDQDNVTEPMLFPGLDGLSRWLKRYYGPGPNKLTPPNDPSIRRIP